MREYFNIFLGALIGWILPYIFKYIVFIVKRRNKNPIYGSWYLYLWWANNRDIEFVEMNVLISRGVLHKHKIKCWDNSSNFSGEVKIEDNNLCVEMNANDAIQVTSTYHRYDLLTQERRNKLFGFWLSFDSDNNVSCGGSILSRDKIYDEEKDIIAKEKYKIMKNCPLMILKR